ncbi:MAG: tetratricopeptide repeat protein, partial [Actinobacteria bacterium]|nr:tetratricopeptide repeat protein [Actinomycetota bacterium]
LGLLGALALALVGAAIAFSLERDDDGQAATTPPETVRQTVTLDGETVVETVTTQAEPEPEPPPEPEPTTAPQPTTAPEPAPEPTASASSLNDEGFALMQADDYAGALPLLEQAVAAASGTGDLTEAYASYNLAFTRRSLGRCDGVLELLDRSEQIQGNRGEIQRLRNETERAC